jgi:hypothetical protein
LYGAECMIISRYLSPNPLYLDYLLWSLAQRKGPSPGELDYLRAIHSSAGIQLIKAFLLLTFPSYVIRVSSIWLDKYPLVEPASGSGCTTGRRELGDLGVIVRRVFNGGMELRMWIVQGKVHVPDWQHKGSSSKEIELYEKCPAFELFESQHANSKVIGNFDLKKDFGTPPSIAWRHWSYVLFDPNLYGQKNLNNQSCIEAAWPSDVSQQACWSLSDGIRSMIDLKRLDRSGADASLSSGNSEWRRLFLTLVKYANGKTSTQLPRGPWVRNAFALLDAPIADSYALLRPAGSYPGDEICTTGFGALGGLKSIKEFRKSLYEQTIGQFGGDGERLFFSDGPYEGDDNSGLPLLILDLIDSSDSE